MPSFRYTVDDEPQETTEHQLTARTILRNAGLNDAERYLIQIEGRHQVSYKETMDVSVQMHENQKFITALIGVVPVS